MVRRCLNVSHTLVTITILPNVVVLDSQVSSGSLFSTVSDTVSSFSASPVSTVSPFVAEGRGGE